MELINTTPFQFAPIVGRLNHPDHSLTYIIKGTFDLHPSQQVTLSDEQRLPTGDEYYDDDEEQTGSVRYESDFAYFKPHADFFTVGHCFAPENRAVHACPVSVQIGNYRKTLEVFGNRYWKNTILNPETTEPAPFTEMDLRYERSFGGSDYLENPIGRGYCKADVTIADNVLPVPNIQDPNDLVASPSQEKKPVGFGPLNRTWSARQEKMGSYDTGYLKNRWPWFPEDFDWSFFNAAPQNQQLKGYFHGDERLYFENMHPHNSHYATQLPEIRIRCFNRRIDPATRKKVFEEIDLNLDTVWVDMLAEKLVLVWRGWGAINNDEYEEIQQIFLMAEPLNEKPASVYECHEYFLDAQKKMEEEWELAAEEPEPMAEEKPAEKVKPPTPPKTEKITNDAVSAQLNSLLLEAGIDLSTLPDDTQKEIEQTQQELLDNINHNGSNYNPEKEALTQQEQIKTTLDSLALDQNKLPPQDKESKQEQKKFLEGLGLELTDIQAIPDGEELLAHIAALSSKLGAESKLSTLVQENKTEIESLKKQIEIDKLTPEPDQENINNAEKADLEKQKIQDQLNNKESLIGKDFSGKDLSGINFQHADLTDAQFIDCNLTDTNFSEAIAVNAIFSNANLSNAKLVDADFSNADLSNATMKTVDATGTNFTSAILNSCNLQTAQLIGSNFSYAQLTEANLTEACLTSACLNNADMSKTQLTNANLEEVEIDDTSFEQTQATNSYWKACKGKDSIFTNSDFSNSHFDEAELSGADFSHCKLTSVSFEHANLSDASFEAVNAGNINFSNANLTKLRASEFSSFFKANLSQSIGNESIWEHANLESADLSYAQMEKTNFNKANLKNATLFGANMKYSRFLKANLTDAQMIQMNLMQGSLEKANLTQTKLNGSNLYGVEFLDAHLERTELENANLNSTKLK